MGRDMHSTVVAIADWKAWRRQKESIEEEMETSNVGAYITITCILFRSIFEVPYGIKVYKEYGTIILAIILAPIVFHRGYITTIMRIASSIPYLGYADHNIGDMPSFKT